MNRTITAFFDSRTDAEAARQRLTQSRVDADHVRIMDKDNYERPGEEQSFWTQIKTAFMPAGDTHAYEEGMRRGGYVLAARVDDDCVDEAIAILDETSCADFESRQAEWRKDGWPGFERGDRPLGRSDDRQSMTGSSTTGERAVAEERIPLVEEELVVGKREVARGGARVHSYVREVPVHEDVTLREEHVSVERRPVDRAVSGDELGRGDMLRDRDIEMTETAEEAVVAKQARVKEELVLRKTAEEHKERIDDTVRRTEVDVDKDMGGSARTGDSAFAFDKDRNATGERSENREREAEGSGYSRRIDKSGL